ncbi:MAG: BMP family ABC transporter substrate-binding protein [Lachnospiraceae bacterium]|nr:BMP family ABC transporter substrate-binding protein [Lachnospiraceae bacterium]
MRKDYQAALRLGQAAVRKAVRQGVSPYLPALDAFDEVRNSTRQTPVGLVELPLDRIKGNKEVTRNNSFANNFMPLFEDGTEFAIKWSNLYDSFKQEGIRDAIKVYEYMHNFYVQEGNKRVSVSKYENVDFILADVTRILPEKNDTNEVRAYYEFLDYYKVTKDFYIVFTEPGEYAQLAELLGQNLTDEWPEDLRDDLKASFTVFSKKCKSVLKVDNEYSVSEIFLIYISIFPMKTLLTDSDDQIVKNIKMAQNELLSSNSVDDIVFLDKATVDTESKLGRGIKGLLSRTSYYSASSPLRAAFIYESDPGISRWADSHEAGRLYLDEMTGDEVVTASYVCENGRKDFAEVLKRAASDKSGVIFTVSPWMMSETVKAAVNHPEIRYLNCSIGGTSSSVRSYHGKLYEGSFLMGILSADLLLRDKERKPERIIGYLVHNFGNMSMANLNAFAIGVSLIDPECRISMKYAGSSGSYDYHKEWVEEGASMYADFDYTNSSAGAGRPGVYRLGGEKDIYIGTPYYNWGRYYLQIVNSLLSGDWNIQQVVNSHLATNYWFGLSSGVVDIRFTELPYQTRKMLMFFKEAIVSGNLDPFSGELRSQADVIQESSRSDSNTVSLIYDTLPAAKIASMEWMNDNVT